MTKVMLVDDQRLFREGVEALLKEADDIEVIGSWDSGAAAIDQLDIEKPDVILMDIHMPKVDGINTTVQIKERDPSIKIVMLTSFADEDLIIRGINAGAEGFLLKELNPRGLIQSIQNAADDQNVISGEAARILVNKVRNLKLDEREILGSRMADLGIELTRRELDIAYLLMKGDPNRTIAKRLHLGEGTVKNYISEIYSKLNCHRRKEIVHYLKRIIK